MSDRKLEGNHGEKLSEQESQSGSDDLLSYVGYDKAHESTVRAGNFLVLLPITTTSGQEVRYQVPTPFLHHPTDDDIDTKTLAIPSSTSTHSSYAQFYIIYGVIYYLIIIPGYRDRYTEKEIAKRFFILY